MRKWEFSLFDERLGWDTFGVETDRVAAQIAAQHGLNVFCGDIYQANFPDNYFDAVTMNHVVEHVVDPKKPYWNVQGY